MLDDALMYARYNDVSQILPRGNPMYKLPHLEDCEEILDCCLWSPSNDDDVLDLLQLLESLVRAEETYGRR